MTEKKNDVPITLGEDGVFTNIDFGPGMGAFVPADDFPEYSPLRSGDMEKLRQLRPGQIINDIEIEIHTHPAYGLVLGRKFSKEDLPEDSKNDPTISNRKKRQVIKHAILGLYAFAGRTNEMTLASYQGDPFADKQLIKIEEGIAEFEKLLDERIHTVSNQILNLRNSGIRCNKMSSKAPVVVSTKFRSVYALKITYLIAKFDFLMRLYIPLRQMQIVTMSEYHDFFRELHKQFRSIMHLAKIYIYTSCTRETLKEHLDGIKLRPKFQKALKSLGPIPESIMNGDEKPKMIYQQTEAEVI